MTNMHLIFFMFINDKYMSRVFMHKRKLYLWVLDHRRWSVAPTVLSQSWCELILLWSLVSFNVVVLSVLLWRRRSYKFVFNGGLCQIVSFSIWFLLFFHLCFLFFFLFCFVEMKMGGGFVTTLWFGLKSLNLVFWIENLGSLVLTLFCWMHILIQHDLSYLDVVRKG